MIGKIFTSNFSRRQRRSISSGSCLESLEPRQLLTKGMFPADPVSLATSGSAGTDSAANLSNGIETQGFFDGNDSIATSHFLGNVANDASDGLVFSRTGKLHSFKDPRDYYSFHLDNASQVKILLTGLTRDVDMEIYNSTGEQWAGSFNTGDSDDQLELALPEGTWYIKLEKIGALKSKYELNVFTIGNARTSSIFQTMDTEVRTIAGSVGGGDLVDYYRFTVVTGPQSRGVSVELINLVGSGDPDVEILDSSGNTIGRSNKLSNSESETIRLNLGAGTYYIKILSHPNGPGLVEYTLRTGALQQNVQYPLEVGRV